MRGDGGARQATTVPCRNITGGPGARAAAAASQTSRGRSLSMGHRGNLSVPRGGMLLW